MNTQALNEARKHYHNLREILRDINRTANTGSKVAKLYRRQLFGRLNTARAALKREIRKVEESIGFRQPKPTRPGLAVHRLSAIIAIDGNFIFQ